MKFSIIIPIYNVEKYLDECVESVLTQTYKNFEVILVDDGSPDNCPTMCDNYAATDSRIIVIHKQNGGLSDARNAGLDIATGDFVIFLDSDDYWNDSDVLQKAVKLIESDGETDMIVFHPMKLLRGTLFVENNIFNADLINNLPLNEAIEYLIASNSYRPSAWCRFIRRSILVDNNIKFKKGLLSEDFDWNFHLYAYIRKLKAMPDVFYVYRIRTGSISHSITDRNLEDIFWTIEKWDKELPRIYHDPKLLEAQFNQLGFMYAMLISIVHSSSNPRQFLKKLKPYRYLLDYDLSPRVRKVRKAINILGIYPTYLLLSCRHKWRTNRI